MSVHDAKKFIDLIWQEPELQARFHANWELMTKVAAERGLQVSARDLHDHLCERWGIKKPAREDDKDTCTVCFA